MRPKQSQGRVRSSERLKGKFSVDGLPARSSNEVSTKVRKRHCLVKRQTAEVVETKNVISYRRPVDCKEGNVFPQCPAIRTSGAEQHLIDSVNAMREICPEQIVWKDQIDLEAEKGKENGMHREVELEHCSVSDGSNEADSGTQAETEEDRDIFLDEDSNQIMPVGQFFGNIELVQDYPPRVPAAVPISRREYRRLHFIAKEESEEDSFEESSLGTCQQNESSSPESCNSTYQSGGCIRNGSRGLAVQKES